MRAVQRHTESQDSRAPSADTTPVQRRDALQGLDYATAVQRLAPVQAKEDTANVHAAAQRGTSGGGGSLPYLGQIQKSFGSHDVSGIKSHTGGKASEACESMGAEAYASGQDVAFKGQPDLHTAAHEAAHIVQQRAGVQLSGGVGKAGDPYERNADEVADRVVQGKSAEDLLGGPSFGGAAAVQRSIQMKGGLLDSLKSFFLEAKLTGPQQKVAKILAEKHGVDVSGLPTATFASLYKDAGGDNPKQSPEKTAANMASAARDHVGDKKPTQKKESGVVSGVSIQRKESRQIQRFSNASGAVQLAPKGIPAAAQKNPYVLTSWHLQAEHAAGRMSTAELERQCEVFGRIWLTTNKHMAQMEKEMARLQKDIVKAIWSEATIVTINNWGRAVVDIKDILTAKDVVGSLQKTRSSLNGLKAQLVKRKGKGAVRAGKAALNHGKAAKEGGTAILEAGKDLYELLKDPTSAPTEDEAIETLSGALNEIVSGLDPQEILKAPSSVGSALATAVKDSGWTIAKGSLQLASAKGLKNIKVRKEAAEAALTDMRTAHIGVVKLHRAVNHGYFSLKSGLMKIKPGYKPPY